MCQFTSLLTEHFDLSLNSEAPGDSNIVVHFAIEFKDKGVHLHNLTAALACQTLGKHTFLPSLGQVGEFAEQECSG